MQVKYAILRLFKFASEVGKVKYASKECVKYESEQLCKYETIQISKCGSTLLSKHYHQISEWKVKRGNSPYVKDSLNSAHLIQLSEV